MLLQVQFAVHPGPQRPVDSGQVGVAQEGANATRLYFAQPTVVLTSATCHLLPVLVGTLIQQQYATPLHTRCCFDLLLDPVQGDPRRPRQVRHEVLHVFPCNARRTPDVGVVAVGLQAQQATQIVVGIFAGVASPSLEAPCAALPKAVQTLRRWLA